MQWARANPHALLQHRRQSLCDALAASKLLTLSFSCMAQVAEGLVQVERNLHDAMGVARNVMMDPRLVPGGGAVEMAVSRGLSDRAAAVVGPEQVRRERAPSCVVHQ